MEQIRPGLTSDLNILNMWEFQRYALHQIQWVISLNMIRNSVISFKLLIHYIIDDTVLFKFTGNSFALMTTLIMKVKMQKL